MALSIAVDNLRGVPDVTEREEFIQGTITFSGSYVVGGDTLSFAGNNKIQSRTAPNRVEVYEEPVAGTQTATGLTLIFAKGTTQANGTLQIFGPGTEGAPMQSAAAAYGSSFAATTVKFRAWFPLGM